MSILQVPLMKRFRLKRKSKDISVLDDERDGWFCKKTGELAAGFPIGPNDVYIDVGCGQGTMSRFAGEMGATVVATDIDQECVDATLRRVGRTKAKSVQGFVSDSNPLPVESGTCTRVASMEVMEHVDDPAQFVRELVRVAAPGALLMMSVPDPASEAIQKELAPEAYWQRPNHLRIFEREQFKQVITDAGLVIERVSYRKFFSTMYWSLFWAADQELGEREKPVLRYWRKTWGALLECSHGDHVKATLDRILPKSQVIVARKPVA